MPVIFWICIDKDLTKLRTFIEIERLVYPVHQLRKVQNAQARDGVSQEQNNFKSLYAIQHLVGSLGRLFNTIPSLKPTSSDSKDQPRWRARPPMRSRQGPKPWASWDVPQRIERAVHPSNRLWLHLGQAQNSSGYLGEGDSDSIQKKELW